jgi:hypothetical protein
VIVCDGSVTLTPFIDTANALTNWLVTQDTLNLLDDVLLERIETYLAAHFYEANRDRKYASHSTGRASGSVQGATAMVLMSSDPGQTACLLDVTGTLAAQSKVAETGLTARRSVIWLGTPVEDQ